MLPSHRDFLVRQEQYQDLLREAEQERLIRAAKLFKVTSGIYSGKQLIGWDPM